MRYPRIMVLLSALSVLADERLRFAGDDYVAIGRDGEPAAPLDVPVGYVANAILHHDDGAIHDHAEVDGSQAQEADGDPEAEHAGEREQHGKRNRQSHE